MASKYVKAFFPSVSTDLFPTRFSLIIFVSYMGLFINQGILVTATKTENNSYNYNTTAAVLFTEVVKLVAALVIYLREKTFDELKIEVIKSSKILILYFVPALLYCLYNNLAFVNLAVFDPTTYYLLLQFRVVVTGIVFQILFKKQLSRRQWFSLVLLTIGCIVKQLKVDSVPSSGNAIATKLNLNINLLLILLQVFCSCFAGVYNEYLMKDTGVDVHIMVQNGFLYIDSVACNLAVLTFQGQLTSAFTASSMQQLLDWRVLCIVANNTAIGIVTSLFLRSLNSILKTFASALELMFTAVLCWMIFGITIDYFTVLAIMIVSYATFLYSQNPVVNKAKNEREAGVSNNSESLQSLLQNGKEIESV